MEPHLFAKLSRLPVLSHSSQDLVDFLIDCLSSHFNFRTLLVRSHNYLPLSERSPQTEYALYNSLFSELLIQCADPLPHKLRALFQLAN